MRARITAAAVRLALPAILVVVSAGRGVETRSSIEGGELIRMQRPLRPIQPTPGNLRRWATEPRWSFGPFDESRFGFRSFTVILERTPLNCNSFFNSKHGLVRFIVATDGARGTSYRAVSERFSEAGTDPCDRDHDTSWSVADMNHEPPTAALATPDPSIPIIEVAYSAGWSGWSGGSADASHHLIFDMRTARPVLAARLSSLSLDGHCEFAEERPTTACQWDAGNQDFVCAESLGGARRFVRMMSGGRLPGPPNSTSPRTLAAFVDTLIAAPTPVGSWAEPDDVGAVRLIAEVPSATPGRRLFLFGASNELGAPFLIAVREQDRTRTLRVKVDYADVSPPSTVSPVATTARPIPLDEYRLTGEPPSFTSQQLARDRLGTRLFRIVEERQDSGVRDAFHVAIQETAGTVLGHAIHFAQGHREPEAAFSALTSHEPLDACFFDIAGFARPTKITLAPLRIDYDVEPEFQLLGEEPERSASECVVSSHAVWRAGRGFAIERDSAACSDNRFRAARVQADGSLEVRTRPAPRQPR